MTPHQPEPRLGVYVYRALDLSRPEPRKPQAGMVLAATPVAARAALPNPRWQILSVRRRWRPLAWQLRGAEILLFTQQLAALLKAGLPLLHILSLLAASQPGSVMRQLLQQIQREVAQGRSLAQALSGYQPAFGSLYVAVVAAGELSGRLEEALHHLAQSLSKQQHLQRQLRLALAYPALILALSVALVLGLIGLVLPSFVAMYEGMGVALPAMTLWLLRGVALLTQQAWWLWLMPLFLGLAWQRLRRRDDLTLWLSRQALRLPFLGRLRQNIIVARWAHTFAMLYGAGLPLLPLLDSVAKVSQHRAYALATEEVRQKVAEGQSLSVAMRGTERFPELLLQLVLAGEEAGALDDLLYRAAAYYTDEVDQAMALLAVWLEPLLLLCLGVVVGGVLLALYLPLFNIGDVIG